MCISYDLYVLGGDRAIPTFPFSAPVLDSCCGTRFVMQYLPIHTFFAIKESSIMRL